MRQTLGVLALAKEGPLICPKCGSEYRLGFTECADCGVSLVECPVERPAESPAESPVEATIPPLPEDTRLVTVFSAGNPGTIAIAKSMLQSAEIDFAVCGEGVQDLFGWGRFPGGDNLVVGPIEIQVRSDDATDAATLLAPLTAGEDIPTTGEDQ
jgi:hypothetical protein